MSVHANEFIDNLTLEDIKLKRQETREQLKFNGISPESSRALRRGDTEIERKAAWPFDLYNATGYTPISYYYYSHDVDTSVGKSKCIGMYACGFTLNNEPIAADQIFHHQALAQAHLESTRRFYQEQEKMYKFGGNKGNWLTNFANKLINSNKRY